MKTEYSRLLIKRSDVPGLVPTIGTFSDINDWTEDNIYQGEWFMNVADQRLWVGLTAGVMEFGLTGSTGFLPLSGGVMSGDIEMSTSTYITSLDGSNIIDMSFGATGAGILISADNSDDGLIINNISGGKNRTGLYSGGVNGFIYLSTDNLLLSLNDADGEVQLDGNLSVSGGYVIKSGNGGGQINLDAYGSPNEVLISTDNGAWTAESQLYLSPGFIELTNYDPNGVMNISAGYNVGNIGSIVLGKGTGVRLQNETQTSIHIKESEEMELLSIDGSITLSTDTGNDEIKVISSLGTHSTTSLDKSGVFISTSDSTINMGVTNSVIMGGSNITADTSNTVYVPYLNANRGTFEVLDISSGGWPPGSSDKSAVKFRGLTGSWAASSKINKQSVLKTTDATPTIIDVIPVGLSKSVTTKVIVTARNSTDNTALGGEIIGTYVKNSSPITAPTSVGVDDRTYHNMTGSPIITFNPSLGSMEVVVTGIAAKDIYWYVDIEYITVGTDV